MSYLTTGEVAQLRRCSIRTIYRHIDEFQATKHLRRPKGLPAYRPNGSHGWLIKESDAQKWIEG